MKRLLMFISLLFLFFSTGTAEIKLNGLFRNDFIIGDQTNKVGMSDVLENRLLFTRKTDNWRFYTDLRIYLLYGEAANTPFTITLPPWTNGMSAIVIQTNLDIPVNLNLMRAFVRFYTTAGDFTLGKTYVNFGKKGVFNPFEMNKSLNFSDLEYDREGILALAWNMGWDNGLELSTYVSPQKGWTNSAGGFSTETHVGSFDIGAVYNRKQYGRNVAGFYFQGDIELGVHGAWAYHCDDYGNNPAHEINFGLDYSFFAGKLIIAADYYHSTAGATNTNAYTAVSHQDRFLQASDYVYANISYIRDEFFSAQCSAFVNLIDGSTLILPMMRYTLFDGLDWTVQGGILAGTKHSEFDPEKLGTWSLDVRMEAKL